MEQMQSENLHRLISCFHRWCFSGWGELDIGQGERMAQCPSAEVLSTLGMCQGAEPWRWSALLPCAMGRWGRRDWPLITFYFGFVSKHCTLPRHSHLPFLQGKRLKKQREWWRGGQECELLGKGEVKHRCRSQFYWRWHRVCCL